MILGQAPFSILPRYLPWMNQWWIKVVYSFDRRAILTALTPHPLLRWLPMWHILSLTGMPWQHRPQIDRYQSNGNEFNDQLPFRLACPSHALRIGKGSLHSSTVEWESCFLLGTSEEEVSCLTTGEQVSGGAIHVLVLPRNWNVGNIRWGQPPVTCVVPLDVLGSTKLE